MEANFKAFKGGKSKANKGLLRYLAGRELPAAASTEIVHLGTEGDWGFDANEVDALFAPEATADRANAEPLPGTGGEMPGEALQSGSSESEVVLPEVDNESEEGDEPSRPVAAPNMFAGMANTVLGLPAQVLRPDTSATKAQSRSSYKIEKDRPEQNGIKRPSTGGLCRAVWDAMDHHRESTGELPSASNVRDIALANNWNKNNAMIEFYQWRKFNGITGRAKKVEEVPAPEATV